MKNLSKFIVFGTATAAIAAPLVTLTSCGGNEILDAGELEINGTILEGVKAGTDLTKFSSIKIPKQVTEIAPHAFDGIFTGDCTIRSITFNRKLKKIGAYAFHNCENIKCAIDLPTQLESIGEYAFSNCSHIVGDIIMPDSLTTVGEGAFNGCWSLAGEVRFSPNLTNIEPYLFNDCISLTGSIVLPQNIEYIGSHAFHGCIDLTGGLNIPDSVYYIGDRAFEYCWTLDGNLHLPKNLMSIGAYAFAECSTLIGSVLIPENVVSIGDGAFYHCSSLNGAIAFLGQQLKSIGQSAFSSCDSLIGGLIIPDSVTSIGKSAFKSCRSLSGHLILSENLNTIEPDVFSGCENLVGSLSIPEGIEIINQDAFLGCTNLNGSLRLPSSIKIIGQDAFANCSHLTGNLFLPDSLEYIGPEAFSECRSLSGTINIPDQITEINSGTFWHCDSLNDVVLPEDLTSIGHRAFGYCGFSKDLVIPASVQTIGNEAFSNCRNLQVLSFDGVGDDSQLTTIGQAAFSYCRNLRTVDGQPLVLPSTLISLGQNAFEGCVHLDLSFDEEGGLYSLETVGDRTFYNNNAISGDIHFGPQLQEIGAEAFAECNNVKELILEKNTSLDATLEIGDSAFENSSITGNDIDNSLQLPTQLKDIGDFAFSGCKNLSTIVLPASFRREIKEGTGERSIGKGAFALIPNLKILMQGEAQPDDIFRVDANGSLYYRYYDKKEQKNYDELVFGAAQTSPSIPVMIPEGTYSIGTYAFAGRNVQTVMLPTSITNIGSIYPSVKDEYYTVFYDCPNLQSVKMYGDGDTQLYFTTEQGSLVHPGPNSMLIVGSCNDKNPTAVLTKTGLTPIDGIGAMAYYGRQFTPDGNDNENNVTFHIRSNIKHISPYAFANTNINIIDCSDLTSENMDTVLRGWSRDHVFDGLPQTGEVIYNGSALLPDDQAKLQEYFAQAGINFDYYKGWKFEPKIGPIVQ